MFDAASAQRWTLLLGYALITGVTPVVFLGPVGVALALALWRERLLEEGKL